jgi:hypothetical protein
LYGYSIAQARKILKKNGASPVILGTTRNAHAYRKQDLTPLVEQWNLKQLTQTLDNLWQHFFPLRVKLAINVNNLVVIMILSYGRYAALGEFTFTYCGLHSVTFYGKSMVKAASLLGGVIIALVYGASIQVLLGALYSYICLTEGLFTYRMMNCYS